MEIALSALYCLNKPLEEAIPIILETPTRNIELVDAGPHTLTNSRVEKLLEIKDSEKLEYSIHSPYTDINIASDDAFIRETILKRIESSIRYASRLNAKTVVFHPGNTTALEWALQEDTAWNINLDSTKRLVEYAESMGVNAMIENVPEPFPFLMKSVVDFKRFYNEINKRAYMVLDVAHAHIRDEEIDFIKKFGDKIAHVHVSDNHGDKDSHLKIGDGSVNWDKVMEALKESPFDGWVTIESHQDLHECIEILESML
jgi:sugar phosphate isomerase/epimerase